MIRPIALIAVVAATVLSTVAPRSAACATPQSPPDLTRGDEVPKGATHDWTHGATGARGWMFSHKLTTRRARQIAITSVAAKSPAADVLEVGDVILGVEGKAFSLDPREEFGAALVRAESSDGRGRLRLSRFRKGVEEEVVVQVPILGDYSATAPFACAKSKRILEQGCKALAERMAKPSYRCDPIPRSLNALALLASGRREYLPLVRREAEWAAGFEAESFRTWYYGYVTILVAEYALATGDKSLDKGLRRLALAAASGQSRVGSWGHDFARPDGLLYGYGMMNSPGLPLTLGLVLARAAGVDAPEVDRAIARSTRLLRFYAGKGAVPYGDHAPWIETHEDNGKCGMAALLFDVLGDEEAASYFTKMSIASHGAERDCGHTGNFFNMLWAMPAVALAGKNACGAWMGEFGARYFDFARQHDGGFRHQGPPEPKPDSYGGWDTSGAYLLAYAQPLQYIVLTGRRPAPLQHVVTQASAAEATALVADGRGWNNLERTRYLDSLDDDALVAQLASWSPVVRERAAIALGIRKAAVVETLIDMLDRESLHARLGACQALAKLGGGGAAAVPALRKALDDDDLWLRIQAAEALGRIGKPATSVIPTLLQRLASAARDTDPRCMEQRYLCSVLFDARKGLVTKHGLADVDRSELHAAIRAGLQNEDGRARSVTASVYELLSFDEVRPLL
ncbi:MAG TPA: DUF6288 domain-containing protein, partial [Planctomycetota bacterium]|nr:DUF6288 domain-containing protein [Planctomycetota bacterium]